MRVVEEVKGGKGKKYYKVYYDKKKINYVKITRVERLYKGFRYLFLINSDGQVIKEVFEYLNYNCKNDEFSVRDQAASSIKLLYSFTEIIRKKFDEFDWIDIQNLSKFIIGISHQGVLENYLFTTQRSIRTHDQYFDNIRRFLKSIKISNDLFFRKIKVYLDNEYGSDREVMKYETNIGIPGSHHIEVPPFISFEEYKKIIERIKKSNSKYKIRNLLIINLMYMRGLRLGEVLGITLEDIKRHPNNPKAGILFIRNRVSDSKDQHAKTCMKVNSVSDYNSRQYRSEKNGGYQAVIIPSHLMRQIEEYLNESRNLINDKVDNLTKEKVDKMFGNIRADCVEADSRENFYLFLNKNYTCLSQSGWSKTLKKIFQEIGITIDVGAKENNLSHRLRHGLAMYLLEVMKKDIYFIKRQMRHRSIQSTLIYLNPTRKRILEETEIIIESISSNLRRTGEEGKTEVNKLKEAEFIENSMESYYMVNI